MGHSSCTLLTTMFVEQVLAIKILTIPLKPMFWTKNNTFWSFRVDNLQHFAQSFTNHGMPNGVYFPHVFIGIVKKLRPRCNRVKVQWQHNLRKQIFYKTKGVETCTCSSMIARIHVIKNPCGSFNLHIP